MEYKEEIAKIISKETKIKKEEISAFIEVPQDEKLGDYSVPCFKFAGKLKKNPVQIAEELSKKIKTNERIIKTEAKNGYLNFFVNKKLIFEELFREVTEKYGETRLGKNKTVVIDFSGPNIGKPMHVGHIRSTILGDSLLRIYHFSGFNTVGINYLGDIGLHIGKLIAAYELWVDKKSLEKNPVKELLRLYVKFCENEKSEFVEGQEEEYEGNEWTEKAKEKLRLLELGDKKTCKIWDEIRKKSGESFDKVYKMLNITFTETTGQSKFTEKGKKIILNALKKGIAKIEPDGAVYVEFPETGLPRKYLLRKGGLATYTSQDLGAAVERYKKYKFDKMLYVTDYRQILHFRHLFEILKKFGFDFYKKCCHVPFGTVNFGKEIIATRKGKIILLEEVLLKTIEKAKEEIEKRKTKGDPEKIGVGAIKYAILKNEPIKDVEFSWESALNFEGDTGPYLQYSYARASSIIRKAKSKKFTAGEIPENFEESEIALAKQIKKFPDNIQQAIDKNNPSLIAKYALELCQIFNNFYHSCQVIGSEKEAFRLKLVEAFKITIKNALYLLGIEVMEEM